MTLETTFLRWSAGCIAENRQEPVRVASSHVEELTRCFLEIFIFIFVIPLNEFFFTFCRACFFVALGFFVQRLSTWQSQ